MLFRSIDCVDTDERLTRSVEFWRDFSTDRTIVGVRECALSAVESILGTRVFEPASTGDSFTARGGDTAHDTARRLRAYWAKYGKLSPAARQMAVLTDPKSTPEAARAAAEALAHFNEDRRFGTQVWTGGARPKPGTNPVTAPFAHPTVAEAILTAYDRDLAAAEPGYAKQTPSMADYERPGLQRQYGDMWATLQDRRITPALARRFDAAIASGHAADARLWAGVCYALAEGRPMHDVAVGVTAGAFGLGPIDPQAREWFEEPGVRSLTAWVTCLAGADTAFADAAIDALAAPAHPYHAAAAEAVRRLLTGGHAWSDDDTVWVRQPVVFRLGRPLLDDVTPTGVRYEVRGSQLRTTDANGQSSSDLPAMLADPAVRRDAADGRACDVAALALSRLLVGGPAVHPLFRDADARLAALRRFVDQHGPGLRPLPYRWRSPLALDAGDDGYATDALFYPADAVAAGGRLPMLATWAPPGGLPTPVLVVRVDRDAAGRSTTHGILGRHTLTDAAAAQVSAVKPIPAE